jgi:hypothetical protein
MPLNMQENDEFPMEEDDSSPPPIKRSPMQQKRGGPIFTTATLVILLVAILGAGGYLLYRYRVFGPKQAAPATQAEQTPLVNPWKSETQQPAPAATEGAATEAPKTPPETARPAAQADGKFAVYINSYRERSDAQEEVGRWVAAGFSSFVDDAQGWHRVGFGRYGDAQAARQDAEHWKRSFENGYWVGPVN